MNAVMISVQPKFCEKIANGECAILVRKTSPKIETPFKCYIYCTNGTQLLDIRKERIYLDTNKSFLLTNGKSNKVICSTPPQANRKIIGEFICDRITKYQYERCAFGEHLIPYDDFEQIEMDSWELYDYLRVEDGYGWHISDLKIYDKPKELSEFRKTPKVEQCISYCKNGLCADLPYEEFCSNFTDCGRKIFTRPPQSWCYVEQLWV